MKKQIITICAILMMLSVSLVIAQQGIHESGTGIKTPELKEASQDTIQGLQTNETMQNMGKKQMIRLQTGNYTNNLGQQIRIHQRVNNGLGLEVGGSSAKCSLCDNMTQEQVKNKTRLYAGLSNGKNAEIKIMPDVASQTALQRLRLKNCNENCTIELKEVGSGNQTRAAYELKTQRNSKVLGMFKAKMQVQAQVDAETGELLQVRKPWWAFLATESEE